MDIKKLTILNIVLAVAVVILFAMHFMNGASPAAVVSGEETTNTIVVDSTNEETPVMVTSSEVPGNAKIAWIDRKKVSEQFELSIQITKQLQDEQITAETKVKQMESNLEKKFKTFQKEAKIMGDLELQQKQQKLQQLEQNYQITVQEMQQKLAISSQEKEVGYAEITEEYMLEIAKEMGLDYIFSYSLGGDVWCANPNMDISTTVISKLNAKFAASDLSKSFEAAPADSE